MPAVDPTASDSQPPDGRPSDGRSSGSVRQQRAAEAISHHLRTPLTIIRSGLALLDEPTAHMTTDDRRGVLADVRQETERLVHVVDDLLAILTPSEGESRTEPLLLQRLLPSIQDEPAAGIRAIHWQIAEDLPAISGDAERVVHLVRDLLTAAATADESGTVRVQARARDRWVELSFRAAPSAWGESPSDSDASALALRSARRLASAMGGRLRLRRTHGYVLRLWLPLEESG
jgi:signal transduction histidine kinase